MSQKALNFKHAYFKLGNETFTTIRGKSWMKKIRPGELVVCIPPDRKWFEVSVEKVELKRISELPLSLLKLDAEFPGFEIHTVLDFVDLLNSFRPPEYARAELRSEVTVLTLKRQ